MLQLSQVHLYRGEKALVKDATAAIHAGAKIGLTGRNGSGKSSLFALLTGELAPDQGRLQVPAQWQIVHVRQHVSDSAMPAVQYVLDGDERLRYLERAIADAETTEDGEALGRLHGEYDSHGGYQADARARTILAGLGFAADEHDNPVNAFSGGWRMRLNLARALVAPGDLLLMDEPTNHLDLPAIMWLENHLRAFTGSLVVIAHDRDFLDNVCNEIWHIEHQQLSSWKGNYSLFEEKRAEQLAQQQALYEKQQAQRAHLQQFVDRFRAQATKAKQAQSRLKRLERLTATMPAWADAPFEFSLQTPDNLKDPQLLLRDAATGYGATPLVENIHLTLHPGDRIALLGANGAGKSTVLKCLAAELPVLAGERIESRNLNIGYYAQHQTEQLKSAPDAFTHVLRINDKLREQAVRDYLGGYGFRGDDIFKPLTQYSGGEQARLLLALVALRKPDILLLDEPTNHLDLDMRHALTVALQEYQGAVVMISHDRYFLGNCCDSWYLVDKGTLSPFAGEPQQWLEQLQTPERGSPPASPGNDSETSPPLPERNDRKASRQEAARRRQAAQPLKKEVQKLETTMEKLEQRLAELEQLLADPALYTEEKGDAISEMLQEQSTLNQQKEETEERWLEKQEMLEAILN